LYEVFLKDMTDTKNGDEKTRQLLDTVSSAIILEARRFMSFDPSLEERRLLSKSIISILEL
jgi:hypothetical protein